MFSSCGILFGCKDILCQHRISSVKTAFVLQLSSWGGQIFPLEQEISPQDKLGMNIAVYLLVCLT
jgi:hypothetical protein